MTRGYAGVAGFSPEGLFGGVDFEDVFGGLGVFYFGGMGIVHRFFRRRAAPRRGENVEIVINVPLERVLDNGEEAVHVARAAKCQACQGKLGAKAGTKPRPCPKCDGSGRLVRSQRKSGVTLEQITLRVPDCEGRGVFDPCAVPGVRRQGTNLARRGPHRPRSRRGRRRVRRCACRAAVSRRTSRGFPAGDLFLVVRTADDPRFERRGPDLYRVETIVIRLFGARGHPRRADAPEGPNRGQDFLPGTQPNLTLNVRGKGLPRFGGGGRGDLYDLTAGACAGTALSAEQRGLYEQLRAAGDRTVLNKS